MVLPGTHGPIPQCSGTVSHPRATRALLRAGSLHPASLRNFLRGFFFWFSAPCHIWRIQKDFPITTAREADDISPSFSAGFLIKQHF